MEAAYSFTTLGALIGLAIAIVLIIKKVHPAYSLILGALIGGLIGGGGLATTVSTMVSGASSMMSSVLRIMTSGILAGALATRAAVAFSGISFAVRGGDFSCAYKPAVLARKLDGGFVSLRAAIPEEYARKAGFLQQQGRKRQPFIRIVVIRNMNLLCSLLLNRLYKRRMVVPKAVNSNS